MILGLALRGWHAPFRGGRALKHHARGGAGLAHRVIKITDGLRAVRVLAAVLGVADSLLDLHPRPVRFQFFRDDHGQRGTNPSPHFRAMRDDDHAAIGLEAEIHVGLPGGVDGGRGRCFCRKHARAEQQRAGRDHTSEKIAAADYGDRIGVHAFGFHAFTPAAIFTACRIR